MPERWSSCHEDHSPPQGRTGPLGIQHRYPGIRKLRSTPHCNGNSVYIFLFWEMRGLSPNFHIHVSVSDLYILGSVHIFPPAEKADPSWEYIIRSQTHECGNGDWGPDIPFLGIFVSNFRHFFFAVQYVCSKIFLPSPIQAHLFCNLSCICLLIPEKWHRSDV